MTPEISVNQMRKSLEGARGSWPQIMTDPKTPAETVPISLSARMFTDIT